MYHWARIDKEDLRKDLRANYKGILLNSFGKKVGEASCIEKQKAIEWTKQEFETVGYRNYVPDFNSFFRKTFEKEIRECKNDRT